jgi:hypothetical protein
MGYCSAEALGNCSDTISKEHVVTEGMFPGRTIFVKGLPWCLNEPKEIGIASRVGGGALTRWPPSAAQTACAGFPHAAFTKAQDLRCKQTATVKWTSLTS